MLSIQMNSRKSEPSWLPMRAFLVGIAVFVSAAVGCTPQAAPTPTETAVPSPEPTPTRPSNFTPSPAPLGFAPVSANADWTPVEQDFTGVTMVLVPAGCFQMGSNGVNSNEEPEHEQCFAEPFWIDKTEVTNAQFAFFEGEAEEPSDWERDTYPRETITALEAIDFCDARGGRLPTEREWEYAASGPDNLIFPWGNEWNETVVTWEGNTNDRTAPVGSYPEGASWVGALDMSGNVWEWTYSVDKDYPYDPVDGREPSFNTRSRRVMRGGSWANQPEDLTNSRRLSSPPVLSVNYIGFRCVRAYEAGG